MKEWVFGIDGGGTNSRIRVEDLSGELLYEGSSGGTNPNVRPADEISEVLRGLVAGAFSSGLDPRGCRAGFVGSAGVDRQEDRTAMAVRIEREFRAVAGWKTAALFPADPPALRFAAGNDAEPALVGALSDVEGFLLIAGTGSIAYGRSRSGRCERAGGWGHFLGDEGSAFWIAFEGIKRGIRSSEGRDRPSGLLNAALDFFGFSTASDLLAFTYFAFDKARIASFAPSVLALAEAKDALAVRLVDQAARELASLALSVYRRMASEMVRKRLAPYGGLLEKNDKLRGEVFRLLEKAAPDLEIVEPLGSAAAGACRLARELLLDGPYAP